MVETRIIDGKATAAELRRAIAQEVAELGRRGVKPGLAVVLVGEDPASQVYVRNKGVQAVEAGMASFEHRLPAETPEADLLALVARLNADRAVHGILVQLPAGAGISHNYEDGIPALRTLRRYISTPRSSAARRRDFVKFKMKKETRAVLRVASDWNRQWQTPTMWWW